VVILTGEKCEISKYFRLMQCWNIKHISVTLVVSKVDKFKEIKDLQWLNMEYIDTTLDVLNVSDIIIFLIE